MNNERQLRHSGVPFVMFLAWLVWLPLPVGSNRPIWIGVAIAWLSAILVVICVKWMRRRFHAPRAFRHATWAWAVLGVFLFWQLFQLYAPSFMTPGFITQAYEAAGAGAPGITLDRVAGAEALLVSLIVYGAFVCTLLLVDSLYRVHLLLWTLVWVGVVLAVVSGVIAMEGAEFELMGMTMVNSGVTTGTFINRNHFANYLVLALCAGIGLMISMQDRRESLTWRQRLKSWIETLMGPKARLRIFLALMVITVVLTRSRMGNTAFFASLLIVGVMTLFLIRKRKKTLFILIASLVAIDIFIVGTWFGVEQVVDRIQKSVVVFEEEVVIKDQDRVEAIRETTNMIKEAPLAGSGGGGYFTRFPGYRSPDQGFLDHAHNDYLEFTANYGIPAMLLWGWFMWLSFARSWHQLKTRNNGLALGASFASLMAMTAVAIHATVEFNLQIPANAATFMVLLALPWVVSVCRRNI